MAKGSKTNIQEAAAVIQPERSNTSYRQPNALTHVCALLALVAVVWWFLRGCLDAQFTGWDDPGYVNENPLIKDLSWEGVRNIFSKPVMGNYHPLTILSYALDYSAAGLEPFRYHAHNLLLHLLGCCMVYWLSLLLSGRWVVGLAAALLFGIHPMHVESVAWISGRKDVLYGVFYFGACIAYLYYLRSAAARRGLWYGAVLLLFIAALLAKPVAVSLPPSLLLLDLWERRQLKWNLLVEKIPHFLLAMVFGIIAVRVQHTAGAMDMQKVDYNLLERLALGSYALVTYLWKLILPVHLLCFYPYPPKVNGALPVSFYLYLLAAAAVLFCSWYAARRSRELQFGLLFFAVNIGLLLQFLPVGEAILADRYTYVPYWGFFFIAAWWLGGQYEKSVANRTLVSAVAVGLLLVLGYGSSARTEAWMDSNALWRDEIDKEPVNAPQAYNNLGFIYYVNWNTATDPVAKAAAFDSAMYFLNKSIELRPAFVNPYISLGEMLRGVGRYDDAKVKYHQALKLSPNETNLFVGLAILYYITKNYDSSGYYFRHALALKPSGEACNNYGNYLNLTGKSDSAIIVYTRGIGLAPDMYTNYLNRGIVLVAKKQWADAVKDFDKTIKLNPEMGEPYYQRSVCYKNIGDSAKAAADLDKALSLGYKIPPLTADTTAR